VPPTTAITIIITIAIANVVYHKTETIINFGELAL
jgi:hypothetical protein